VHTPTKTMRWLVDDIFIKNKPNQPSSQKEESKHTKKTTKRKKKTPKYKQRPKQT